MNEGSKPSSDVDHVRADATPAMASSLKAGLMSVRQVWPTLLVASYLVLTPGYSYTAFRLHDERRVFQVALGVTVAVGLVVSRQRRDEVAGVLTALGRWRLLAAAAVAMGLLSSVLAVDPMTGLVEVGLLVAVGTIAVAVAGDVRAHPQVALTVVIAAAAVSLSYYAADLLTLPDFGRRMVGLWARGPNGGFDSARFLNQYQTVLIPFASVLLLSSTFARWVRGVVAVVLVTTWWMLAITEGRGATLALLGAAVIVACALGRHGRRVAMAMVVPAAIGIGLAIATRPRLGLSGAIVEGDPMSSSGRLEDWAAGLSLMQDFPLLGIGPGHLAHVAWFREVTNLAHPHNAVIQAAVEWGIPVGILAAAAGVGAAVGVLRRRRPHELPVVLGLPGPTVHAMIALALGAVLLLSLVDGMVVMPVASTGFAMTAGLAIGTTALRAGSTPEIGHGRLATSLVALCLVIPCVLAVAQRRPEDHREERDRFTAEYSGPNYPRFWLQGIRGLTPTAASNTGDDP